MAVSSNGRARGAEIFLLESMIVVDLHYGSTEFVSDPGIGELAPPLDAVPNFDPRARQLRLGGVLLKTFVRAHTNQEIILTAFQEEGWPMLIDDPLPPKGEIEPRKRLRDTIYALNHSIAAARAPAPFLLAFHAEADSEAIRWAWIAPREPTAPATLGVWRPVTSAPDAGYLRRRCK